MICNSQGAILASKSTVHHNVGSPFTVERLACLQAVNMGLQEGFSCVIIEGDSRSIIQKCRIETPRKSEIRGLTSSIHGAIKHFQIVMFQHVGRSANVLSHNLATRSLKN